MRVSTVVVASAFASAVACASFGTDSGAPAGTQPSDDAGGADRAAPPGATTDASADAGPMELPADAFADIDFNKENEFDDFERAIGPAGGPLAWVEEKVSTTAKVIGAQGCDNGAVCKDTVAYCENNIDGWGFLVTDLDADSRVMRLDFEMKIEVQNHDAQAQAQVVSIALDDDRFIFLTDNQGTLRFGDQYRPNGLDTDYDTEFTDLGPVPPQDGWAKYRLYLDLNLGLVALTKDGARFGPMRVIRSAVITKLQKLRMGITYAQYDNFHVTIDDVGLKRRYK